MSAPSPAARRLSPPVATVAALALLAAVILAVYARASGFALLSWDDDQNITLNPWLAPGLWQHFWTEAYLCMYVPLVYTVWYGLKVLSAQVGWPLYHTANIALHLANAGLVLALTRTLAARLVPTQRTCLDSRVVACLAAALFALHPLAVETVAWATGLRDLLSACGALTATWLYLLAASPGSGRRGLWLYALSSTAFIAALLAKPAVAFLPVGVGVLSCGLGYEPWRQSARRLVPWLGVALAAVYLTRGLQAQITDAGLLAAPWSTRLMVAADSFGFYLRQALWPDSLAVDYGRTPSFLTGESVFAADRLVPLVLTGAAVLALGLALSRSWRGRRGLGAASLALFAVFAWLPTSGLIPFAYQHTSTVADHYAYLPLAATAMLLAVGGLRLAAVLGARAVLMACVVLAVLWASLAAARLRIWRDDASFFPAMVAANPQSYGGWTGLAALAMAQGDTTGALVALNRAAAINPRKVDLLANQGLALNKLGRYADALALLADKMPPYSLMIAAPVGAPVYAKLYMMLAYAQIQSGQIAASLPNLCWARWADPMNPDVRQYLPLAAKALGQTEDPAKLCPPVPLSP